jgi:hypothetical protein
MSGRSTWLQALAGVSVGAALLAAFGRVAATPLLREIAGDTAEAPPGPRLVADRTEIDLGVVPAGGVVRAAFEIRNPGGRRLVLRKTNGDCDCLSTGEDAVIVEPGGCRTVVARLDTGRASGPVRIGVHYQTNDPRRPRLSLSCRADIAAP